MEETFFGSLSELKQAIDEDGNIKFIIKIPLHKIVSLSPICLENYCNEFLSDIEGVNIFLSNLMYKVIGYDEGDDNGSNNTFGSIFLEVSGNCDDFEYEEDLYK